jgi:membrane-associated protease RseP (regulator of RpoE activity)
MDTSALLLSGILAATLGASDDDYASYDANAMLGINMTATSGDAAEREGIDTYTGVEIQHTHPGTTATAIGLRPGDVILGMNGNPINSMTDLRNEVALTGVGGIADIEISRNGQRQTLRGDLGTWPPSIPKLPIDAEAERQFRDYQAQRQERLATAAKAAQERLAALEDRVSNPAAGGKDAAGADPAIAALAAADPRQLLNRPASAALAAMPAWKVKIRTAEYGAGKLAATAKPTPRTATVAGAWSLRFLAGNPTPEIF